MWKTTAFFQDAIMWLTKHAWSDYGIVCACVVQYHVSFLTGLSFDRQGRAEPFRPAATSIIFKPHISQSRPPLLNITTHILVYVLTAHRFLNRTVHVPPYLPKTIHLRAWHEFIAVGSRSLRARMPCGHSQRGPALNTGRRERCTSALHSSH